MDNDNMKYINTDNLTALIYNDGDIKLQIYNKHKSAHGWSPRNLVVSHLSVKANEFTYNYVSDKVDKVYSTFNKDEVHELLNKVKQYNES